MRLLLGTRPWDATSTTTAEWTGAGRLVFEDAARGVRAEVGRQVR